MYRQVLTPSRENNTFVIPNKWYGQTIEIMVYPVSHNNEQSLNTTIKQQKRFALDALLDQHLLDLSDFKFNRDEANNYE
ncbi:hypothetical protein AGMMS4956_07020 [Bacteroidia bacterium]|nr:hypothetical protein AGMMS4956_07020 [Bacteroidia bacterium]